ncbi:hypothetical protein DFH09DRAFT_1303926 [Mycena vulgaris]|nr:hypothetical protein DFH09DRAFT_1303926 [Mycena vulgaris]
MKESGLDSPPFFPSELEREIFETVAEIYPDTIASLLLVSQRVHEWIERVKFRTVIPNILPIPCSLYALQQTIRSNSKPTGFFHDRVRNLFIGAALNEAGLQEVLAACSGVQSLVLIDDVGPSALPSLGAMQPRRLHVHLTHLFGNIAAIDPSHLMFAALTHLDLFDDNIAALPWHNLALLPALTHLALFQIRSTALAVRVLAACTRLEVLIDMQSTPPAAEHLLCVDDVRFVYLVVADTDYASDWVVGTKGGLDFWARADAFLAKKRRGEIKPGLSFYSRRCS